MTKGGGALLVGLLALGQPITVSAQNVPVARNLWRLIRQEDTDDDQRITVHDRSTPSVVLDGRGSEAGTVEGTYPLSVLLQELKRADDQHLPEMP